MRTFSRWLRNRDVPRLVITVVPGAINANSPGVASGTWLKAFKLLEERKLPATWAVTQTGSPWPLGAELVASTVGHELGLHHDGGPLASSLASLERQTELARAVNLKMRTWVTSTTGVHPALLTRFRTQAVVPIAASATPSRTGTLRAAAWNCWEVPVTDRISSNDPSRVCQQLRQRLDTVLRHATRLHMLWSLSGSGPVPKRLIEFLDAAAEFHRRGWIKAETAGEAAAELAVDSVRRAA